jgi:uncharacterized protein DUF6909
VGELPLLRRPAVLRRAGPEGRAERRRLEQECGVSHLPSSTALRVPAQIVPLAALRPERLDPPLGDVDADRLAASEAVVVNIDYPLGVAAYNILRKVAVDSSGLRGVFVLGKAATLNADVGGDDLERRPRRALTLDLLAR